MSPTRTAFAALSLCTFLTVSPTSTHATTVLQVTVAEMTATSQWVVRAQVLDSRVADLRAYGQGLFTDVDLLITDVYSGSNVPSTYTLRMIGGRGVDGTTLKIPGMPGFRPGQDVVVFLEATSLGHIPCGLGQGVWRVFESPSGEWVRQSSTGVHMMRRNANGRLGPMDPRIIDEVRPLDDLVDQIIAAGSVPVVSAPGLVSPPSPITVKP